MRASGTSRRPRCGRRCGASGWSKVDRRVTSVVDPCWSLATWQSASLLPRSPTRTRPLVGRFVGGCDACAGARKVMVAPACLHGDAAGDGQRRPRRQPPRRTRRRRLCGGGATAESREHADRGLRAVDQVTFRTADCTWRVANRWNGSVPSSRPISTPQHRAEERKRQDGETDTAPATALLFSGCEGGGVRQKRPAVLCFATATPPSGRSATSADVISPRQCPSPSYQNVSPGTGCGPRECGETKNTYST